MENSGVDGAWGQEESPGSLWGRAVCALGFSETRLYHIVLSTPVSLDHSPSPRLLTSDPVFFTRVQSTTVASHGLEGTVNLLAFLFFDSSEKNRAWRKVEGPMGGAKGSLSVEAGRGAIAPLGAEKGQEAAGFKCWLGDL